MPTKAPTHGEWIVWQNFSLLFNAVDSEKYLGYAIGYNMSNLQDMSNFLFKSMKGPKVGQRIQVSILL